jgi:hypothetical protein
MNGIFNRLSFWVTALLILAMVGFIWGAFAFRADARIFPLAIAILTLVLLAITLLGEFFPRITAIFEFSLEGVAGSEAKEAEEFDEDAPPADVMVSDVPWKIVSLVFGTLVLYALGILFLGFAVATPIYLLLFLRLYGGASWIGSGLLAVGMTAAMVFLSSELHSELYPGMLFGAGLPPF